MTQENKPDWCNYNDKSDDIWQAKCIGYPLILYDCIECIYYKNYKPKERSKIRSKTFEGIAKAMAEQWG